MSTELYYTLFKVTFSALTIINENIDQLQMTLKLPCVLAVSNIQPSEFFV